MGIPTRHSGAPFADGETLAGADLELDIANIVTEMGNIEDVNVASGADINGSKLADNTVANAKLTANTITTAKMNQSAVMQAYVSTATATGAMTTATTFQDVEGITDATITPGAVGDYIFCDLMVTFHADAAATAWYKFGFSVDGTDTTDLSTGYVSTALVPETVHTVWAATATATSAHVIKPRYRAQAASGSDGNFTANFTRVFRVQVIPQK